MGKQYLNKMTIATLGLATSELEACCKGRLDAVEVAKIYGFIKSTESGKGTYGDYVKFRGEFEGVDLLKDQTSRSGVLLLPAVAEIPLVELAGGAEEGQKVQFGIIITVRESGQGKSGVKFTYGVRQLIEASADDELSRLAQSLPVGNAKALPAPKSKAKK
jgi:hypothetical protein